MSTEGAGRSAAAPGRRAMVAVIACAAMAGIALAAYQMWPSVAALWERAESVPTLVVAEQEFVRTVAADGNLKAEQATPIVVPPRVRGSLKVAWLVPDGTRVKEGEVVIRFDDRDIRKELEDGEAARVTADSKIAKERIDQGAAERNRERTADQAERELDTVRQFKKRDELVFSRNQIIESEIDETLSSAKKDHAAAAQTIEGRRARSQLDLLHIERRTAQLKIDEATKKLASLEVKAPHDGVVVFERDWWGNMPRVGATVWGGQTLAELPLVESMEAEVFVLEADASGLEPGKKATVVLEARSGVTYQAEVKRVETLAKQRFREVPIQYFGVILSLERTDPEVMKPGARVSAQLVLDQRQALIVPRQTVFEKDGKNVVYRRLADGTFEPVEVTLGAGSPGRVVIDSGL
ncbi:MAG: efflux RND transporter periplasmic adaptor subunit, partial [Myxococcota bacterium]